MITDSSTNNTKIYIFDLININFILLVHICINSIQLNLPRKQDTTLILFIIHINKYVFF